MVYSSYLKQFPILHISHYDYTKKNFTLEYAPNEYLLTAMPNLADLASIMDIGAKPYVFNKKKHMSTWILGASFSVSF